MAPSHRPDWEAHKATIINLYWAKNKRLAEVIDFMEKEHGFSATSRQYKTQLKNWGLGKNINSDDMRAMLCIQSRRRVYNKKETRFTRYGVDVRPEQLGRFARRHNIDERSLAAEQVALPAGVRLRTPEPDSTGRTLPEAPDRSLPSAASESTDSDTGSPATLAGSSSPDHNPLWVTSSMPSSPIAWHAGARPEPMSPSISLAAHFDNGSSATIPGNGARNLSTSYPLNYLAMLHQHGVHSLPYHQVQSLDGVSNVGGGLIEPMYWGPFNYFQEDPPMSEHGQDPNLEESRLALSRESQNSTSSASAWEGSQQQDPLALAVARNPNHREQAESENYRHPPATANTISDAQMNRCSFRDDTELHRAVIKGDLEKVKTLMDRGLNPNVGSITPLHYAAFQRDAELVKLLKSYGARLDAMADNNRSVLYFAVCSQDRLERSGKMAYAKQGDRISHTDQDTVKIIRTLYDSPSEWPLLSDSLLRADSSGVTPLMAAAEEGFYSTVAKLIKRGAAPHVKDHLDYTALKYAAGGNSRDIVCLLLEADPRVQKRDVNHMLKLATRNLSRQERGAIHLRPRSRWWDSAYNHDTDVIATEMVRIYQRLGVLGDVIELARRKGQTSVAECLSDKRAQLNGLIRVRRQ